MLHTLNPGMEPFNLSDMLLKTFHLFLQNDPAVLLSVQLQDILDGLDPVQDRCQRQQKNRRKHSHQYRISVV